MRRLAVLVALLASAVVAAWLALRTPHAQPVEATRALASVEDPPPFVDEWPESDDEFETGDADERELVDVEDSDAEPLATALTPRKLRAGERWAHIRVLDGATGRPVEFFGARASSRTSNHQWVEATLISRMLLEPHPDGAADVAASPKAVVLQIEARGYMPFEGELLADALDGAVQTVELARGGAVIGRVTIDKQPARSVRVRLRRASIAEREAAGESDPFDLTRFAGRSRMVWTARDGRFAFEDLALGTYELDVRGREGARAKIAALEVTSTRRVGVGDVALTSGATLRGKALLPPNTRARGVRLFVQASGRTDAAELDKHASFEISGLPAGPCSLNVNHLEGVVIAGAPFQFELAAGETRDVVLDLRERRGMWIVARVRSGGRPVGSADISLLDAQPSERPFFHGRTAADGSERWWQEPVTRVSLRLESTNDMPLGRYDRGVVVLPSGEGLVELDLELAELSVDWRQLSLPGDFEELELNLESLSDPTVTGGLSLRSRDADAEERAVLARREFDLGPILADRFAITLVSYTRGESFAESMENAVTFTRTITLRAGERAVCSFTDADRAQAPANVESPPRKLGY